MQPCPLLQFARYPGRCDRCGKKLVGRQKRWCSADCDNWYWDNHYWANAKTQVLKRDGYQCVKCGSNVALEVNHIVPVRGKGYKAGCQNHQGNLETLCHDCHVVVTNEQRAQYA